MSLLASISQDLAQDRQTLLRRYAELLASDAESALAAIATPDAPALANTTDLDTPGLSPSKSDDAALSSSKGPSASPVSRTTPHASRASLKALKQLMHSLDKTESDLAADLTLLRRAARAQRFATLPADHLANTAAAQQAVAAYDAETQQLLQSRRAEYFRLYNAACELQEQHTRATNARHELQRLKQANPDLLAHIEVQERPTK